MGGRFWQRTDPRDVEGDGLRQRPMANATVVVRGVVRGRLMRVAGEASLGSGVSDVHPLRRIAEGVAGSAADVLRLRQMLRMREDEQPRAAWWMWRPAHLPLNRSVVASSAERRTGKRTRGIPRSDAGVASRAERKKPGVSRVRKAGAVALRSGNGRDCREQCRGHPPCVARHCPKIRIPGSLPSIHSRRTAARRCVQSGPGAPLMSVC